jgi:hypothetical protein
MRKRVADHDHVTLGGRTAHGDQGFAAVVTAVG